MNPLPFRSPALAELLLAVMAVLLLASLARPLADPVALDGLGGRYRIDVAPAGSSVAPAIPAGSEQSRQRVREWLAHGGERLACLAATGLLVLTLGRLRIPAAGFLSLGAAAWAGCAAVVEPLGIDGRHGAVLALLLLGLTPLISRRFPHRQIPQVLASPWHFPGFVLLSGLGLLWLLDYAARGYGGERFPRHPWLGLSHADGLFLAYATLTLTAGMAPLLLDGLARLASRVDTTLHPAEGRALGWLGGMAAVWLAAILAVIWVKTGGHWSRVERAAALTSEMLRVPAWIVLGWICYRWLDCGQHPSRAGKWLMGASAALVLGLFSTGDKGQVLLYAMVLLLLLGILAGAAIRSRPTGSLLVAMAVVAPLGAVLLWGLHHLAPLAFSSVAERMAAMDAPYNSRLVHLAQLGWFLDAIPMGGYGLAHVPWCGHLGGLGGICDGVPKEIQSDYALFGLAGVWGMPAALGVALLTLAWLTSLSHVPDAGRSARSLNLLGRWLVTMFVASSLVQLSLTVFGSLGSVALTGVTFPLQSFGHASLLVTAAFVGLATNTIREN